MPGEDDVTSVERAYPFLPFVEDVQVVFDVGAGTGGASAHFARHYPEAAIHAFEPDVEARRTLERDVARLPNVRVRPFGLPQAVTWSDSAGIARIDILKARIATTDVDAFERLAPLIPGMSVLYVRYETRAVRRRMRDLLGATHDLYTAVMYLDEGACIYLRKDLAALDVATERLRELLYVGVTAGAR